MNLAIPSAWQMAVLERYRTRNVLPLSDLERRKVGQVSRELYRRMVRCADGTLLKFVCRDDRYYPSIHTPGRAHERSNDEPVTLNLISEPGRETSASGPAAKTSAGPSSRSFDLGGALHELIRRSRLDVWPHPNVSDDLSLADAKREVCERFLAAASGIQLVRGIPLKDFLFDLDAAKDPYGLQNEIAARAARFCWPRDRPLHALLIGFPLGADAETNRIWLVNAQKPLRAGEIVFPGRGRARTMIALGLLRCDLTEAPVIERIFLQGCYVGHGFLPVDAETESVAAELLTGIVRHWVPHGIRLQKPVSKTRFGDLECHPDFVISGGAAVALIEIMGDRERGYVEHTRSKIDAARKVVAAAEAFDFSMRPGTRRFERACGLLSTWAHRACIDLRNTLQHSDLSVAPKSAA